MGNVFFEQRVGIPKDTNYAPPSRRLAPLFAKARHHTGASKKRYKASPILKFHVPLYR